MNAPDQVTADLRRYEAEQDRQQWDEFDWDTEDHIGAVVPFDFIKPIHALLSARVQMKDGPLKEELDNLYRACVTAWGDL